MSPARASGETPDYTEPILVVNPAKQLSPTLVKSLINEWLVGQLLIFYFLVNVVKYTFAFSISTL